MAAAETVAVPNLHGRLRQLGATYMAETSNNKRHIYWIGANRTYVKVKRHPKQPAQYVVLTYHRECPCIHED